VVLPDVSALLDRDALCAPEARNYWTLEESGNIFKIGGPGVR
jgi:hypothetical protein